MIHAASREALATLRERAEAVRGEHAAGEYADLAAQLYAVTDLLTAQPRLRRTLGDPATAADARAGLAQRLFGGRIGADALEIVSQAVSLRWSSPWDLLDGLESVADDILFAAADEQNVLDEVEDELFRFERVLEWESDLAGLLDDASVPSARRVGLLDSVLSGKVQPVTLALLEHAVTSQRKRTLRSAIDGLLEAAAKRRERSVARVLSAAPLTDAQTERLADALSQIYGRTISIRSAVDPSVRGGLLIRIGDEVIDGSVAHRLEAARAALAG